MNKCQHLNSIPTYKIEGGFCINCEKYTCYNCTDFAYKLHLFSTYGKDKIAILNRRCHLETIGHMMFDKLKQDEMAAVCYDCVEKLNHPGIKAYLCCFFTDVKQNGSGLI